MRRADRLFQIVQLLRGGRLATAAGLAERLEVAERTIYRDIADLKAGGVPIDGEAGVGYVLRPGFDLPPLMFDADELVALVVGARMVQACGGSEMGRAATEAIAKIEAVAPSAAWSRAAATPVHAWTGLIDDDDRARLDAVDQAIARRTRLHIAYEDAASARTRRVVRPLGLWFWGRVWTLAAWCELRENLRTFRVDRIVDIEAGAPFALEPGKTLMDYYRLLTQCEETREPR